MMKRNAKIVCVVIIAVMVIAGGVLVFMGLFGKFAGEKNSLRLPIQQGRYETRIPNLCENTVKIVPLLQSCSVNGTATMVQ